MKKTSKKFMALVMTTMMVSFVFAGCGSDTMNDATGTDMTTEVPNGNSTAPDGTGEPTTNDTHVGDGRGDGVVGDVADGVGNAVGDVANGVGDAVGDVARGVGDAVGDVANGVGNAVNGGFESYEDAHDYLLSQLGTQDNAGAYEVRNVKKEAVTYNNGQKGYRFEVHDTREGSDTRLGVFYVDQETGKVYKEDKNGNNVTEYSFS